MVLHVNLHATAHDIRTVLAGGRQAFVWSVTKRAMLANAEPLTMFIKDEETPVCSNYNSHDAFVALCRPEHQSQRH